MKASFHFPVHMYCFEQATSERSLMTFVVKGLYRNLSRGLDKIGNPLSEHKGFTLNRHGNATCI
jgi:hypothetical protein